MDKNKNKQKKKPSGQKFEQIKLKLKKKILENVEEHVSESGPGYQEKQRPMSRFQLLFSLE